ncbi:MAG: hypothetical protein FWB85_01515 [Chitinispirillia bacterium]|nr:hypothetical protein [Chitinispirillia bacterium]MCL2241099.1 hypothetical protein [Chitinispirillia bacterium]
MFKKLMYLAVTALILLSIALTGCGDGDNPSGGGGSYIPDGEPGKFNPNVKYGKTTNGEEHRCDSEGKCETKFWPTVRINDLVWTAEDIWGIECEDFYPGEWRMPTREDWETLRGQTSYWHGCDLISESSVENKSCESTFNLPNETGFSAELPYSIQYRPKDKRGIWRISDEDSLCFSIHASTDGMKDGYISTRTGFTSENIKEYNFWLCKVRCVRDALPSDPCGRPNPRYDPNSDKDYELEKCL